MSPEEAVALVDFGKATGELARVADETRLGRERLVQVAERWHEIEAFLADES